MRKYIYHVVGLSLLLCSVTFGQQKLAQTGMKFLSVGADARAAALAGAVTATEGLASSMFYNPAGMGTMNVTADLTAGRTLWIADINYNVAAVAFRPGDGDWGVFGLSALTVDYGDLLETIPDNSGQGFTDLGTFKPTAYAIGLGYARALNEKFSVGTNIKYVRQWLGNPFKTVDGVVQRSDFASKLFAFDLGVLYRTGYKSLAFGMSIRNFSTETKYEKENFQLPLTFRLGVAMNMLDLFDIKKEDQSFILSIDAEHPRDYQEQVHVGAEYTFLQLFALRAGYVSGTVEEGISLGVGAMRIYDDESNGSVGADYAYTPFGIFSSVHRFSFRFSF